MENLWIIAQAGETTGQPEVPAEPMGQQEQAVTVADGNSATTVAPAKSPSPYTQLIFVVAIFVVMYFILFREPRKRQKKQQQMVQSLKKNDRVRTIGGMIGTIIDIKGDEVLLKVDESNNTKIWFVASAIGKNLANEEK